MHSFHREPMLPSDSPRSSPVLASQRTFAAARDVAEFPVASAAGANPKLLRPSNIDMKCVTEHQKAQQT